MGEDSSLPESSARGLARVGTPVLTSGRGRATSPGMIRDDWAKLRLRTLLEKTLTDPAQRVRNVDYHNFCLPHASLRVPLAAPVPTNGTGSAKMWHPCPPAMAAGLTDHIWTLREVLLYRVPPWPQPAGV
jgi:hypothetical protein